MSKTLWKIALIPLKTYIDLTFHPSFQASHSFKLSLMLVSFCQSLVIQIHFPLNGLAASDDLRIAALWAFVTKSPVTFDDLTQHITLTRIPWSRNLSKMIWRHSFELQLWVYLYIKRPLQCFSPIISPSHFLCLGYLTVVWSTLPSCCLLSLAQRSIIMWHWTQIELKCFLYISDSLLACPVVPWDFC